MTKGRRCILHCDNKAACAAVTTETQTTVYLTYGSFAENRWADQLSRNRDPLPECGVSGQVRDTYPRHPVLDVWVDRVCAVQAGSREGEAR